MVKMVLARFALLSCSAVSIATASGISEQCRDDDQHQHWPGHVRWPHDDSEQEQPRQSEVGREDPRNLGKGIRADASAEKNQCARRYANKAIGTAALAELRSESCRSQSPSGSRSLAEPIRRCAAGGLPVQPGLALGWILRLHRMLIPKKGRSPCRRRPRRLAAAPGQVSRRQLVARSSAWTTQLPARSRRAARVEAGRDLAAGRH